MLPVAQRPQLLDLRDYPTWTVAIGGLIVGTIMTLVFIPIWFIWFVKEESLKDID